jgi:hypothetical protein
MLSKEKIVERLLDEKLITTEEAVVLLKGEDFNGIKYVPVPTPSTNPWIGPGPTQPYQPYTAPSTPYNPMYPQCDWTVRPETMPYYGSTTHSGSFAHTTNENYCAK